jgi:hypothetical protein
VVLFQMCLALPALRSLHTQSVPQKTGFGFIQQGIYLALVVENHQ